MAGDRERTGSDTGPVVALLGLRGAGKSTVGRLLAQRLDLPFLDLDELLVEGARHAGQAGPAASAGELLAHLGVLRFRALESDALRRVLEPEQHVVLATGGGVVERADNRTWLRRAARCVFLDAPVDVLEARLRADPTPRPPLTGSGPRAEIAALAARRRPHYLALAELVVDAGEGSPEEVTARILDALHLRKSPARDGTKP